MGHRNLISTNYIKQKPKRYFRYGLFSILIFWNSDAISTTLELREVKEAVRKNLPLLQEAEQKVKAAEAELKTSQGAFDTKLKVETQKRLDNIYENQFSDVGLFQRTSLLGVEIYAGRRAGTGKYPIYDQKYLTSVRGEGYVGAIIPLLRDLWIDSQRLGRDVARLNLNAENENYKLKVMMELNQASRMYWSWLLYAKVLRIRKELLELAELRQKIYIKRSQVGDLEKISLNDNLRLLNKRQAELNESFQEFTSASLKLQLYMGRSNSLKLEEAPIEWTFTQPEMIENSNDLIENSKESWPQFKVLAQQQRRLELENQFLKNQRLPTVSLKIEGVRDLGEGTVVDSDPDDLAWGLFIEYPLENNSARGKVSKNEAEKISFEATQRWTMGKWENQFNEVIALMNQNVELINQRKNEVENTVKMRQAENVRVSKGASDLYILNLREEDEALAKINLHKAFANYHQLMTDLETLKGQMN